MKQLLLILITLFNFSGYSQNVLYDENIDGELSTDHTNPTGPFVLEVGENTFITAQGGDGANANYFSFTILEDDSESRSLDALIIDNYDAAAGNQAFLGMQAGDSFTTDANNTSQSDLLGGLLYGSSNEGNDILPIMADLPGAQGFDIPLGPGTYTIWLNQTGPESQVTLRFEVGQTLSTTENKFTAFSLYPNPAQHTITIDNPSSRIKSYRIADVSGKTVMQAKNVDTQSKEIDLSALDAGIYLITVQTNAGSQTSKFIKL